MVFKRYLPRNKYVYSRQGLIMKIGSFIPTSLKVFGGMTLGAAAMVVFAPAVFILATPPLLWGTWIIRKRVKHFNTIINEQHNRRWKDLASFHLKQEPESMPAQKIPTSAKLIFENSLETDEQDLKAQLDVGSSKDVDFGALSSLAQDFQFSPSGGSESMAIAEYPLIVRGKQAGVVRVVSRKPPKSNIFDKLVSKSVKMRVEVQLNKGTLILLQASTSSNNQIIQGHGKRIK